MLMIRALFVILIAGILLGCSMDGQINEISDYEGPMYDLTNVETYYSTKKNDSSAFLTYKLMADKQLIMENQDQEFPEGLYIENYKPDGSIAVTIKGNHGYFNKKENIYRAVGDVVVRNLEEEQTLNTEELFWKPGAGDESIYTDQHVIVKRGTDIMHGNGLRANENFQKYRILEPYDGTITIQE
jgi:LPS export ABC transporter protein LptC